MVRKKRPTRKKYTRKEPKHSRLGEETVLSVWALIVLALAALFVLSGFGLAGSAGELLYSIFFGLLGWGYVLLPITLIGIAINFLVQRERKRVYSTTLWGAILFLAGALGLIEVLFDGWGGIVGSIAGYPHVWFGNIAWAIITTVIFIIGIIVALDHPIKLKGTKKEKEERTPIPLPSEPQESAQKEPDEEDQKEQEPEVKDSSLNIFKGKKKGALISSKDSQYNPPPLDLLRSSVEKPNAGDLRANANIIKRTLESFGIAVEMGEINIGPKVTRYTLRPAEGVKLSRILALNQDLAMALASHPIRIEAPIPGKPYVGIEVPNRSAAIVRLGNLISYPEFSKNGLLSFPLGRDVTGEPLFANIEKMPHLLIAGATGSGKSITLHSLLISLLYRNSPANLKLILIDPKRVELPV